MFRFAVASCVYQLLSYFICARIRILCWIKPTLCDAQDSFVEDLNKCFIINCYTRIFKLPLNCITVKESADTLKLALTRKLSNHSNLLILVVYRRIRQKDFTSLTTLNSFASELARWF